MMDYANERYVRLYVRDTVTWKLLTWEARALLAFMIRKADRAGVIDHGGAGVRGLAAIVEMPFAVVERALPELLAGGDPPVVEGGGAFVIPNYIAAQEAPASDPQRQRELRARRRDRKIASQRGLFDDDAKPDDGVTDCDDVETDVVTQGGHETSRGVTPSLAEPSDPGGSDPSEPDIQEQVGGERVRAPRPKTDATPFMNLPCTGGQDFVVTADMVAEWKSTYPGVNVEAELRRARQWSLDNPQKRKTIRGARKFLGSWIDRQQNRGGGISSARVGGRTAMWDRAMERAEERDRRRDQPDVDDRLPPEDAL